MKKIDVQYCYRRGERVSDPERGIEVQELAMALALSSGSMTSVTVAKRNAGSLTDPNGHYQKVFDRPVDARAAWDLVKRWRTATSAINTYESKLNGRDAQLAVHGNRFIEHILLSNSSEITEERVKKVHATLKTVVEELHGTDCYLAVLFKNSKKCSVLQKKVMEKL